MGMFGPSLLIEYTDSMIIIEKISRFLVLMFLYEGVEGRNVIINPGESSVLASFQNGSLRAKTQIMGVCRTQISPSHFPSPTHTQRQ